MAQLKFALVLVAIMIAIQMYACAKYMAAAHGLNGSAVVVQEWYAKDTANGTNARAELVCQDG